MQNKIDKKFAVVGLGALFPDARNITEFWQNILSKKVSIRSMPEEMLNSQVYYRPDLLTAFNKEDKTTTRVAAWIDDLNFDTVRKYRIPPSVAEHMDANQHAALYVTDQALAMNPLKQVDQQRVAVILGNGMVGTRYGDALDRVQFQLTEHYLRSHPSFLKLSPVEQDNLIQDVRRDVLEGTIPISEDCAPGILPNIIAGRIASVFDFHGPSFTVDAACASVLAALIRGLQGLQLDEYDAVICGGSDMPLKNLGFVMFSALNALSPDGSYPFDGRANGFVMGQGAGALVLKRLKDAVANQDEIVATITGYGEASDGKGKYIAAPNADWQAHTIIKACQMAGYPVDTIELMEAHGTATRVGDVVEVEGLKKAFAALGATRTGYCGLTSVKSNIGHLKSAAGIAGLIKAILALHYKILPPTANFLEINPKLEIENSPFYILADQQEWQPKGDYPRRANVSSFGFGGADYHITLEEFRSSDYSQRLYPGFTAQPEPARSVEKVEVIKTVQRSELITFSADDLPGLDQQVESFLARQEEKPEAAFAQGCLLHNFGVDPGKPFRLAFLSESPPELAEKASFFQQQRQNITGDFLNLKGIYYRTGPAITPEQTAILFPGQASQYPGMFMELRDSYDVLQRWFQKMDAFWLQNHTHTVSSLISSERRGEGETAEILRQTQNAHPAIFLSSFALYQYLHQMGLEARFMAGHSLGEITALAAAGMISPEHAFKLVSERGSAFHQQKLADPGKMISLKVSQDEARELVQQSGLEVWIANLNSPNQTIVAGGSQAISQFQAFVETKSIKNQLLAVSHAFHTPLMAPVADRFIQQIQGIPFTSTQVRVLMNHQLTYYPDQPQNMGDIPALLKDQILQPVRFIEGIRKLYEDGVRLFVEVGPGSILSNLAREILEGKDVLILTSNFKNADELACLQKLSAGLFSAGVPIEYLPPRQTVQAGPEKEASQRGRVLPTARPAVSISQPVPIPSIPPGKTSIVYSGAAIGLPGSYKETFRDDNFDQVFEGRNFIERLTDSERQMLVDLQISKLVKDESGPTFKLLTSLEDVIQLAGKAGKLDMIHDYYIDEKIVRNMTSSIALGVAVGYEALSDAQIPLVREYRQTSTGSKLPQKLALPKGMQDETGVIFANGFPLIDPVIQEVSRAVSYRFGSKTRQELMSFYESIIPKVKDPLARKLLSDWYTLYYSRLSDHPGEEDVYQFNHHFMTQISAQANNILAMLVKAKGPNFQMNAACSSTSNALTIAQDFIRSGRVKRMIIIGADDPTHPTNLPYLGAGFLCTGAATNEADLYKAALPFDNRRNGMLMGAGAVGIVLETQEEVEKRGVAGICELLGTHSFNAATHISQIDAEIFSQEFNRFIYRMELEHDLTREQIARQAIYISHEPFTPPRGGCSQTEAQALRGAFGKHFGEIIVGNSKGMTGHTMGASLEDALLVKSLQYGKCPPVVNLVEHDPVLEGLNLWRGGDHQRTFALKLSAGFGSQGHFALVRKISSGDRRIVDQDKYQRWLSSVSPESGGKLERLGRILCLHDPWQAGVQDKDTKATTRQDKQFTSELPQNTSQMEMKVGQQPPPPENRNLEARVINLVARVTGYPPEMLEPEMELDSDLGLDTARQQAIRRELTLEFNLAEGRLQINGETTLRQILDQVTAAGAQAVAASFTAAKPDLTASRPSLGTSDSLMESVIQVISEITKYPPDMLEPDMELEADLGIDTVKKATILAILAEKFHMEQQPGMKISDYPTIRHIVELLAGQSTAKSEPSTTSPTASSLPAQPADAQKAALSGKPQAPASQAQEDIAAEVLKVFSEVTKYPPDMLELDMEVEADLGIDTVKKATILAILGEKFHMEQQPGMKISDYPTIRHIVNLVESQLNQVAPPAELEKDTQPPDLSLEQATRPPDRQQVSGLSREIVHLVDESLEGVEFDLAGKSIGILGDDIETIQAVTLFMQAKGSSVIPFVFSPPGDDLTKAMNEFANHPAFDLLLDCSHIGTPVDFIHLSRQAAQDLMALCSESRFAFFKMLASLEKKPARIICLTAVDGSLGLDGQNRQVKDPSYGALLGFYKALRKEWPETTLRILDLSPQALVEDFQGCLELVYREIQGAGVGVEICYPGGRRQAAKICNQEPCNLAKLEFTTNDTFLISGGGTGLGALLAEEIALTYQANLVIIDLLPLPEDIDRLASLDEKGLQQLKDDIHTRLKQTQTRVTPVMLNQEFEAVTRAIEIHKNLEKLRKSSQNVVYIPCDVRDVEALGPLLDQARAVTGPITAILHAAGLDRSHLIDQKSMQEFHAVFTVKAQGANTLFELCQGDPLRLVVVMASISGRFGNAAQLDYSAANSYLSYWIRMLHQALPGIHALSLVWSGWKEVGMAWRNEIVRQYSEESGLNLIEVEQGINAFFQEIETSCGNL